MTKFVPLDKQSKKARKAYHKKQRKLWTNGLNPSTRIKESKKIYKRNRFQTKDDNSESGFFFS